MAPGTVRSRCCGSAVVQEARQPDSGGRACRDHGVAASGDVWWEGARTGGGTAPGHGPLPPVRVGGGSGGAQPDSGGRPCRDLWFSTDPACGLV